MEEGEREGRRLYWKLHKSRRLRERDRKRRQRENRVRERDRKRRQRENRVRER
jgi:hypothetical protein